jgi:hypothetical protein
MVMVYRAGIFGSIWRSNMGARRIVRELGIRRAWETVRSLRPWWDEADLASLSRKLDDPRYYNGGIVRITAKEHRAWPELNRRIMASNKRAPRSPLLAWVAGRGVYPVIRVHDQ